MALPTQIGTGLTHLTSFAASSDVATSSAGPFIYNGNVYFVCGFFIELTGDFIAAYKATDPTSSFTEQDSGNRPISGGFGGAVADVGNLTDLVVHQKGAELHVFYRRRGGGGSEYAHYVFDCSSDTWTDNTETPLISSALPDYTFAASVGYVGERSDGDLVVVYRGTVKHHGTDYAKIEFSRREGTTWTTGTRAESYADNEAVMPLGAAMGGSDYMNILGYDASGWIFTTVDGSNSPGTVRTSSTPSGYPTLGASNPDADHGLSTHPFTQASTNYFGYIWYDQSTQFLYRAKIQVQNSHPGSFPTLTNETIIGDQVGQTADSIIYKSAVAAQASNGKTYCMFVRDDNEDLFLYDDGGGSTWSNTNGGTTPHYTGTVYAATCRIYTRGSTEVLAFVYQDTHPTNATTVYYDEYEIPSTAHNLTAQDIESASEVSASSITQVHALTSQDAESTSEVQASTLTQTHALNSQGIESASEVQAATASEVNNLTSQNLESASEVQAASITQTHVLSSQGIESASEVQASTITQQHELASTDLEAASEVQAATLTQLHLLTSQELQSTSEVEQAVCDVAYPLVSQDIQSTSEVQAASITQLHALSTTDLESASEVQTATLTQLHLLTSQDLQSTSEVQQATCDVAYPLVSQDLESASEVQTATIDQVHVLATTNLESASEVSNSTITQVHPLVSQDIESASEVSNGVLSQTHLLTSQDLQSLSEIASSTISQVHILTHQDIESASEVQQATLTEVGGAINLTALDIESASEISMPTLDFVYEFTAQNIEVVSEVSVATLEELLTGNWYPDTPVSGNWTEETAPLANAWTEEPPR